MNKSLLLLLVLVSVDAYAGMTKWVDENGRVHYSEGAPRNAAKVEHLQFKDTRSDPAADNPYEQKSTAEMEEDFQRGKTARENAAKKDEQAKAKAEAKQVNCMNARNNLRTLQQSGRAFKMDESGERVYLDESQRQQQIDAAQQAANQACN